MGCLDAPAPEPSPHELGFRGRSLPRNVLKLQNQPYEGCGNLPRIALTKE
jgi:hypothetical protein